MSLLEHTRGPPNSFSEAEKFTDSVGSRVARCYNRISINSEIIFPLPVSLPASFITLKNNFGAEVDLYEFGVYMVSTTWKQLKLQSKPVSNKTNKIQNIIQNSTSNRFLYSPILLSPTGIALARQSAD